MEAGFTAGSAIGYTPAVRMMPKPEQPVTASTPQAAIVLASGSPRRRQLLRRLGLRFDVHTPEVDETPRAEESGVHVARRLALAKAGAAARDRPDAVVIAADTVVAHRGAVLGKPADAVAATAMLHALRGRTHAVITAVCVAPSGREPLLGAVRTAVRMRSYTAQ